MKFIVTLSTNEKKLATILQRLGADCQLVELKTTDAAPAPKQILKPMPWHKKPVETPKPSRFVGGKRLKDISGKALALQILSTEPLRVCTVDDLKPQFKAHGFAENSIHAVLFKLKADHKILYLGDGRFCMPGTTIHLGASAGG